MFSGRPNETELSHVTSERSGSMMVLAVNVIRYGSTERYKFCSRGDWKEPSLRDKYMQNRCKANPALCSQDSRCRIKSEKVIEGRGFNDRVIVINAAVAVAPSESVREDASIVLRERQRRIRRSNS